MCHVANSAYFLHITFFQLPVTIYLLYFIHFAPIPSFHFRTFCRSTCHARHVIVILIDCVIEKYPSHFTLHTSYWEYFFLILFKIT